MEQYIEIFTLVTGLVYLALEISQKNAMWIVGTVTSAAAVYMFAANGLYASMALNIYYCGISVLGYIRWQRDRKVLLAGVGDSSTGQGEDAASPEDNGSGKIHLNRLSTGTVLWSALVTVVSTVLLAWVLRKTGDGMPLLDASIAILNAVATYWLSKSYFQQWYILIFVNILSVFLCFSQGLYWMTAQYAFYTVSSVFGVIYWRRRGVYVK